MDAMENEMVRLKNKYEHEINIDYVPHYSMIKEEIDKDYRTPYGLKKLQTMQEIIDQEMGR
jgi:hypothetical protein